MKYIFVVIAGSADHAPEKSGISTPFEIAKVPNMHFFAARGRMGSLSAMPARKTASADAAFMNLMGYDPDRYYTGIGPLEAADLGLELGKDEIPFRMNFVTEAGGRFADATAGGLTTREALALVNYLNKKNTRGNVRFHAGHEYRHLAVIRDSRGFEGLSAAVHDPEMLLDENVEDHLPSGQGSTLLRDIISDARLYLQDHEINQVRVDLMENPANMIWLWGQGGMPALPEFHRMTGMKGTMISHVEFARGLARLAGLEAPGLPELTGNFETDIERQAKAALKALETRDFVCCYLNDCDLASRRGDLKAKVSALEATDYFLLSWIREYFERNDNVRVLVTSGHVTPWRIRRPVRERVPLALAGQGISSDEVERFSEAAARAGGLQIPGGKSIWQNFSGTTQNINI